MPDHIAVYAGSFDPVTNGHVDLIERAAPLFGTLIVAIGLNRRKPAAFDVNTRKHMLQQAAGHVSNTRIESFEGLLVDYAKSVGARTIIRGLRQVADFDYEMQQVLMNKRLCPDIETIFLITSSQYSYLSSSLVKEVSLLGGSVEGLVPAGVLEHLEALRVRRRP